MQHPMRWSDLCMHFKFEFVHAFQDQENINIRITFFWGEKLIVHIHVLTKIFENLKVITLYSAVTKSELGNKMCMLTRSIQARKKKMYTRACKLSYLQVSELPSPSLQFVL